MEEHQVADPTTMITIPCPLSVHAGLVSIAQANYRTQIGVVSAQTISKD